MDIQICYPTQLSFSKTGGLNESDEAHTIDEFDCIIKPDTHFYLSPDRIIEFYRYIENYEKIIKKTRESHENFVKRIFQRNLGLYDESDFEQICQFFESQDNREKFLSVLSNTIYTERKKYTENGKVWPPRPIQGEEFKCLIGKILTAFPLIKDFVNINVVPVEDDETGQENLVKRNPNLFTEIEQSGLVCKNTINIFIFLRHHEDLRMNIHANLCIFLPSQDLCISYDDSGISRRKKDDGTIDYENIIDTSIFIGWLNKSPQNKLYVNESFIHKDYHSCGATTLSILISRLAFLEKKLKDTHGTKEQRLTLLCDWLAELESKFHTKKAPGNHSYQIFTEGDVFDRTAGAQESTPDLQMLILGQRKEILEFLEERVKKLEENERIIFDIEKFLEDFKMKQFISLEEDLSSRPASGVILANSTSDELRAISTVGSKITSPQSLATPVATALPKIQSTSIKRDVATAQRTSVVGGLITRYVLVRGEQGKIIQVNSSSLPLLANLKQFIERHGNIRNLPLSSRA